MTFLVMSGGGSGRLIAGYRASSMASLIGGGSGGLIGMVVYCAGSRLGLITDRACGALGLIGDSTCGALGLIANRVCSAFGLISCRVCRAFRLIGGCIGCALHLATQGLVGHGACRTLSGIRGRLPSGIGGTFS